jgi:hypothetical protein
MSTVMNEPVRLGRFVSVTHKQCYPGSKHRPEPVAPETQELRLLLYLGLGGAGCLLVLAVTGLFLMGDTSQVAAAPMEPNPPEVALAVPMPQVLAAEQEAALVKEVEPIQELAVLPEVLPEPARLEANLDQPNLALAKPAPLIPDPGPADILDPKPAPVKPKTRCEKLGTQITFLPNPPDAFMKAKAENKLVFFVHLSGIFEDKEFT